MVSSAPAILTARSQPIPVTPIKKETQSPLSSPQLKAAGTLIRRFNFNSPLKIIRRVRSIQRGLKPGEYHYDGTGYVSSNCLHIPCRKVGEGGFSSVYGVSSIFTERVSIPGLGVTSPSKMQNFALKESKGTGREICPIYEKIKNYQGLDQCFGQYLNREGRMISLHHLYKGTIRDIDYTKHSQSIKFLLESLKNLAIGLKGLHAVGIVHRDIKGDNSLVDASRLAVLTDFDDSTEATNTPKQVRGTSLYLDPAAYPSLISQRKMVAVQTKATDIYAFGRMIELDIFLPILLEYGQKYGLETGKFSKAIFPRSSYSAEKYFHEKNLQFVSENYPLRAILVPPFEGKEKLIIFKPISERRKLMLSGLKTIEKHLFSRQYTALLELTAVTYKLQAPQPKDRPNAEGLVKRISEILDPFIDKKRGRDGNSLPPRDPVRRKLFS